MDWYVYYCIVWVVFERHIFRGWQLGKGFCNFIFEVHLCPSSGVDPMKEKFKDENIIDSEVTVKFMSLKNYCVYGHRQRK